MSHRARIWLTVALCTAPLFALSYRPDIVAPLVQRTFVYPADVAWLLAYDTLMIVPLWGWRSLKHRGAVAVVLLFALYLMTGAYWLRPTQRMWGLALIVPSIAMFLVSLFRIDWSSKEPDDRAA
jgi:uncharacterized membrane protein